MHFKKITKWNQKYDDRKKWTEEIEFGNDDGDDDNNDHDEDENF